MSQKPAFTIRGKEIEVSRPEPLEASAEVIRLTKRMDMDEALEALEEGRYVMIRDFFSTGLNLLRELKQRLSYKGGNQTFESQRAFRKAYRERSHRVLLRIERHKITARKSPIVGWFEILYPDVSEFLLPFPQVQGLNSSWQWYEKGIKFPGLRQRIHPYYGVYFPTRFDHVLLFDAWLKNYAGKREVAIDVGTGCGVLAFLLRKYRFGIVHATDHNPNAIIGLQQSLKSEKQSEGIELYYGDLFADCDQEADLIVFNPPWLPADKEMEGLDTAIYYDEHLFPAFFAEAKKHLKPDGQLVLLFSNLAQVSNLAKDHPIEKELASGARFEKVELQQAEVKSASKKTRRNAQWRSREKVELWVLRHK